jgi:Cu/Ag efflux protein CusF
MNVLRLWVFVLAAAVGVGGGYLPMSQADEQAPLKLTTRARIVSIDPQTNLIKLRTEDDKPLAVLADNQTKIRLNDREIRLADVREGSVVTVVYQAVNEKNMASALTVNSSLETSSTQNPPTGGTVVAIRAPKQMKVRGQIVKVLPASNEFVLRQADGHEDVFYLDNTTGAAADLQEGAEVTIVYQLKNMVSSVAGTSADGKTQILPRASETATPEGAAAGFSTFEGSFFQVSSEGNFVILKDKEGKERKFFTQKNSEFMMNKQKAKLSDFQPGSPVNVRFRSVNGQDTISNLSSMPSTPLLKTKPR